MFCTKCGSPTSATDNFCGHCGTPVHAQRGTPDQTPDWREATDIRVVLHHPQVKEMVAAAAGANGGELSAEDFLDSAKPLLSMAGLGAVPFRAILDAAPQMYARFGVETGRDLSAHMPFSPGRTMAATLCSLASRGQPLIEGAATETGSSLKARLQSSVLTFQGHITITFAEHAEGTNVHAQIAIPGQAFDWGRSKQVLDDLIADIPRFVSLQP